MTDWRPHHVELDSGITKVAGVVTGNRVFWVDIVEVDGGRLGVWLGHSYHEAIVEAERARIDFELHEPVKDLVAGHDGVRP
ncbi:MAG TPA: hypothetical protein VGV07_21830 [Devosia sp.]|jgi:hypothetical protein|uniref:hypothetical protein n=1 Tax=Devosia sp. TaxID=1871048 RepID=UPI002DDCCA10|nr:hypothetical protein [Devosia sp.]HEV2517907.1 hypothetical protein [Devosia sp.]